MRCGLGVRWCAMLEWAARGSIALAPLKTSRNDQPTPEPALVGFMLRRPRASGLSAISRIFAERVESDVESGISETE